MATPIKQKVAEAKQEIPQISPQEARQMQQSGQAVLVDVREDNEVAKGRAKGAIHASRGTIEFKADPDAEDKPNGLSTDKTVVVYCGSGSRAALAAKALKELGYKDVRNMGGFKDWVEAGGEVEQ